MFRSNFNFGQIFQKFQIKSNFPKFSKKTRNFSKILYKIEIFRKIFDFSQIFEKFWFLLKFQNIFDFSQIFEKKFHFGQILKNFHFFENFEKFRF